MCQREILPTLLTEAPPSPTTSPPLPSLSLGGLGAVASGLEVS